VGAIDNRAKVYPVLLAPNVVESVADRLDQLLSELTDANLEEQFDVAAELAELRELAGTVRSWL